MKTTVLALLAALATLATLAAASARAGILTSGNFQTGTPTPTLNITTPFTLTITVSGSVQGIAFDEWATSDGAFNNANANSGQFVSYRIDTGATVNAPLNFLVDNNADTANAVTANDGYFFFTTAIAVTAGQTLTILPGTATFASGGAGFNPPPAVFNGNAFAFASDGSGLSNPASVNTVPEPSTWALLAVSAAALGLVVLRQRRA